MENKSQLIYIYIYIYDDQVKTNGLFLGRVLYEMSEDKRMLTSTSLKLDRIVYDEACPSFLKVVAFTPI